jgi:RNA polymerase sigma factor (sigma-70 family)
MAGIERFDALMEELQQGVDDAAVEVHRRYVRRLVSLAYRQFDRRLRVSADPEDAVQSAFKSFFRRCRRGEFQLHDWDGIWNLLAWITVCKCRDRRRLLMTRRRDITRELAAGENGFDNLPGREPTPDEAAMLTELLVTWVQSLGNGQRPIVELGLEGCSDAEIAQRLRRSERTVRRARHLAELKLRASCGSP